MADLAGTNYTDLFAEQHLKDATGGSVEAWKNAVGQQNQLSDEYLKSILSGKGSAAQQQMIAGQGRAQNQMQAQALGRGANPGNERAAMYAGANAQAQAIGASGALRAQEEQAARMAQMQARQFGANSYGQQAQFNAANQQALWALKQHDLDRDAGNDAASSLGNAFGGVAGTVGGIAGIASDERLKRDIRDAGMSPARIRSAAEFARKQDFGDRLGREPDRGGRAEALSRDLGDAESTAPWRRHDDFYDRLEARQDRVGPLSRELAAAGARTDATLRSNVPLSKPAPDMGEGSRAPWQHVAVATPEYERPRFSLEGAYGRDVPRGLVSDEHSKEQISDLERENADLRRVVTRFQVGPGGRANYTSAGGENVSGKMDQGWAHGDVARVSYLPEDPERSVSIRNETADPSERGFHEHLHETYAEDAEDPTPEERPFDGREYERVAGGPFVFAPARPGLVSDERSKEQIRALSSQLDTERAKNGGAADEWAARFGHTIRPPVSSAPDDMSHLDPVTKMYPWTKDPMVLASDERASGPRSFAGQNNQVLAGEGPRAFAAPPGNAAPPPTTGRAPVVMPTEEISGAAKPPEMSPWEKMMADRDKKDDERERKARSLQGWNMLAGGLRQAFGAR